MTTFVFAQRLLELHSTNMEELPFSPLHLLAAEDKVQKKMNAQKGNALMLLNRNCALLQPPVALMRIADLWKESHDCSRHPSLPPTDHVDPPAEVSFNLNHPAAYARRTGQGRLASRSAELTPLLYSMGYSAIEVSHPHMPPSMVGWTSAQHQTLGTTNAKNPIRMDRQRKLMATLSRLLLPHLPQSVVQIVPVQIEVQLSEILVERIACWQTPLQWALLIEDKRFEHPMVCPVALALMGNVSFKDLEAHYMWFLWRAFTNERRERDLKPTKNATSDGIEASLLMHQTFADCGGHCEELLELLPMTGPWNELRDWFRALSARIAPIRDAFETAGAHSLRVEDVVFPFEGAQPTHFPSTQAWPFKLETFGRYKIDPVQVYANTWHHGGQRFAALQLLADSMRASSPFFVVERGDAQIPFRVWKLLDFELRPRCTPVPWARWRTPITLTQPDALFDTEPFTNVDGKRACQLTFLCPEPAQPTIDVCSDHTTSLLNVASKVLCDKLVFRNLNKKDQRRMWNAIQRWQRDPESFIVVDSEHLLTGFGLQILLGVDYSTCSCGSTDVIFTFTPLLSDLGLGTKKSCASSTSSLSLPQISKLKYRKAEPSAMYNSCHARLTY